jgi:hypothetical protein
MRSATVMDYWRAAVDFVHWVPIIEVQRYKVEIVGEKPPETHQQVANGSGKARKNRTTIY